MNSGLFWLRVDKSGSCWIWTGKKRSGYGRLRVNGRQLSAHRVAYELLVGPIPEGLVLDHLCRNRACVNPEHLEPVTSRVNILRGEGLAAKQALVTHCSQGHEFTPENTRVLSSRPNTRYCRQCGRVASRESQRRRRARLRSERASAAS